MKTAVPEAYYGTREVARMLGLCTATVGKAIWDGRVPEPQRGPGRAFLWRREDIEACSQVLRGRGIEDVDILNRKGA